MAGSNHKHDSEKIFWISFADLNTSLMLCFMMVFLCVTYLAAVERLKTTVEKEKLDEDSQKGLVLKKEVEKLLEAKIRINKTLMAVGNGLKRIITTRCEGVEDIVVDQDSLILTVRFKEGSLSWFRESSSSPERAGLECLQAFVPMWLGEMYKLSSEDKEYIEQLVVEGHTNSRWNEHTAKEEAFLENLKLSQERSLAVARYILDGKNGIGASSYADYPEVVKGWDHFRHWLQKHLSATGRSSSVPKFLKTNPTIEDLESSRRVEFKIVLKNNYEAFEKSLVDYKSITKNKKRGTSSESGK